MTIRIAEHLGEHYRPPATIGSDGKVGLLYAGTKKVAVTLEGCTRGPLARSKYLLSEENVRLPTKAGTVYVPRHVICNGLHLPEHAKAPLKALEKLVRRTVYELCQEAPPRQATDAATLTSPDTTTTETTTTTITPR